MNRFDARDKIISELKDLGLYRGKTENHAMRLARCSRSGDVIEPMVMPQWYAATASVEGTITFSTIALYQHN